MLRIVRIVVGLLYMEHKLAKIVGFPPQPNHAPYALLSLNPGVQGLLELVGGLLLILGLFTRPVAFILAGNMAVAYFMAHGAKRFLPAAQWRGVGNRVLLRLPLFLDCRGWRVEPRSTSRACIGTGSLAAPRLRLSATRYSLFA